MGSIIQLLGNIDKRVLIAAAVVLAILFVISLIKKAIKLTISIGIILAINIFIIPIVKEYQEKYNFRIEEDKIMVTVDGTDVTLSKDSIQKIKFNGKDDDSNMYSITIIHSGDTFEFEVPKVTLPVVEKIAKSIDVEIEK